MSRRPFAFLFSPFSLLASPIPFLLLALIVTAAVLAVGEARAPRVALPWFWLGLGALHVVLAADGTGDLAAAMGRAPPPAHFLEITAAMLAIGLGAPIASSIRLLRGGQAASRVSAGGALIAVLAAAGVLAPLWKAVEPVEVLLAIAGMLGVAIGISAAARAARLADRIRTADRWLAGKGDDWSLASPPWNPGLRRALLATGILSLVPNTLALLMGTAVAALILAIGSRNNSLTRGYPLLLAAPFALIPVGWLLLTVTGSPAPSLAVLVDAPLSPAAGLWIAPWLLVSAWLLLGQWPVLGLVPPPILALPAGLLLVSIGVAAVPDAMLGFQPIVAPLAALSLWWAVATRRPAMGLAALGVFGAAAAPEHAAMRLLLLFAGSSVLVLAGARVRRWPRMLQPVFVLPVAAGCWTVLEAGLRTQVTYTVLAVAAVSAGVRGEKGKAKGEGAAAI